MRKGHRGEKEWSGKGGEHFVKSSQREGRQEVQAAGEGSKVSASCFLQPRRLLRELSASVLLQRVRSKEKGQGEQF